MSSRKLGLSGGAVNLGRWLQQAFEAGWMAVEDVLNPQQLDFGFRNAEIRRAKLIELGVPPARHTVALSVTLKPEGEGTTAIFVGAHPTCQKPGFLKKPGFSVPDKG